MIHYGKRSSQVSNLIFGLQYFIAKLESKDFDVFATFSSHKSIGGLYNTHVTIVIYDCSDSGLYYECVAIINYASS